VISERLFPIGRCGVPFLLIAGEGLDTEQHDVRLIFKGAKVEAKKLYPCLQLHPNELRLSFQPEEVAELMLAVPVTPKGLLTSSLCRLVKPKSEKSLHGGHYNNYLKGLFPNVLDGEGPHHYSLEEIHLIDELRTGLMRHWELGASSMTQPYEKGSSGPNISSLLQKLT